MINTTLLKTEAEKIGIILDETALSRFDKYAEMILNQEIIFQYFLTLLK